MEQPLGIPTPQWARQTAFQEQLRQTTLCVYFSRGRCSRDDCTFAHTNLRPKPDLRKTAICQQWQQGLCNDEDCNYAHGECELIPGELFKTGLCNYFATKGKCRKGDLCRHAHGEAEIRGSPSTPPEAEPLKVRTF